MKIGGNGNSAILSGTSSPDGVVSAPKGTLYVNRTTGVLWQNIDGGTTWRGFGGRQIQWQDGRYYFAPSAPFTTSNSLGIGSLRAAPFYVPNMVTITRIGADITSAGDAGSKFRLGIYADDGTGRPGTLVVDAGQIAGDSATVQEISGLSASVGPGWYWAAGVVQAVVTTQPTVRVNSNIYYPSIEVGTVIPVSGQTMSGATGPTGLTGALPSTWGAVSTTAAGVTPRIFVKVGT